MVFVDGTNLFNRLREQSLKLMSLRAITEVATLGREHARTYIYTTAEKLARAKEVHGPQFLQGCRIVLGDSVPLDNGKFREKGVDALLVADLVYHAAQKNCTYAVVISNDSDFAVALKRVEDFGCNTGVVGVCTHAADRLRDSADDYHFLSAEAMVKEGWAVRFEPPAAAGA